MLLMQMQKNGSGYLRLLPKSDIEEITRAHHLDPSQRLLQKKLAEEVTRFIHGKEELDKAIQTTEKLFSGNAVDNLRELSEEELLQSMEGVSVFNMESSRFETGIDLTSLLAETGIFPSKGEARKMVTGGGVSINKEKLSDANTQIDKSFLLLGKYILVQKGKKNYYLVQAV